MQNYLSMNHVLPPHQHYSGHTWRNTNVSDAFAIGKNKMRLREVRASSRLLTDLGLECRSLNQSSTLSNKCEHLHSAFMALLLLA